MINIEELKQYVEFLKGTDIEELEIEVENGQKIHLKRDQSGLVPIENVENDANKQDVANVQQKVELKKKKVIKSPMVGKFLLSTSKDHPPFVVEGAEVKQGQKIAVIETMKMFKDVVSPVSGVVEKIKVEDGKFVEYGQELFVIKELEGK